MINFFILKKETISCTYTYIYTYIHACLKRLSVCLSAWMHPPRSVSLQPPFGPFSTFSAFCYTGQGHNMACTCVYDRICSLWLVEILGFELVYVLINNLGGMILASHMNCGFMRWAVYVCVYICICICILKSWLARS